MANDGPNVITLLREQHEAIREVFELVEAGTADRAEAFQTLVRLLSIHETAEEVVIWPTVRSLTEQGGYDVADARIAEEDLAKSRLAELERIGPSDPEFAVKLVELRNLVLQHAEREEQEAFPLVERSQSEDRLRMMGTAVQAAEMFAPTHPHPEGPNSAIGNIVLGPAIAVADRARDAIRSALRRS